MTTLLTPYLRLKLTTEQIHDDGAIPQQMVLPRLQYTARNDALPHWTQNKSPRATMSLGSKLHYGVRQTWNRDLKVWHIALAHRPEWCVADCSVYLGF